MSVSDAKTIDIEKLNSLLDKSTSNEFTLLDMMGLTSVISNLTKLYFESLDITIYNEFREISSYILSTKNEITNLQAGHLKEEKIQIAGKELDAIVEATEEATESIMESAEIIINADQSNLDEFKVVVNAEIIKIFEACSFQDLTGQRISRIVEALKYIETRIDRFSKAFEGSVYSGDVMLSDTEKKDMLRKQDLLLHGPQEQNNAIKQDDIDQLMVNNPADQNSNEAKALGDSKKDDKVTKSAIKDVSQDDIDALFN